jgi:hypothetical protein
VGDWISLEREEERLSAERESALRLIEENLARVRRIEKQQQFLKRRGKEMVRRDLKTLDELDEVERKEADEKEKRAEAERAGAVNAKPFPFDQIPSGFLDDVPWADLDFGGENLPASQGS